MVDAIKCFRQIQAENGNQLFFINSFIDQVQKVGQTGDGSMFFPVSVLRLGYFLQSSRNLAIWSDADLSKILLNVGSTEIGRQLLISSGSSFLQIGVITAVLQQSGKVLISQLRFINLVRIGTICSLISFIIPHWYLEPRVGFVLLLYNVNSNSNF